MSLIAVGLFILGFYLLSRLREKAIIRRTLELNEIIGKNREILQVNKQVLGRVEMGAFQVKENMIWMYDHYKDLLTVLQKVKPYDMETLQRAAIATEQGMNIVADTFKGTFNVTPEEYHLKKVRMTYTNQSGQSYPAPNASVN